LHLRAIPEAIRQKEGVLDIGIAAFCKLDEVQKLFESLGDSG
jgi:hypothetical protein